MKIGYIVVCPWIQNYGVEGATIHVQEVCCALQNMGHNVFLITGEKPPISETIKTYDLSIPSMLHFAQLRSNLRKVWTWNLVQVPSSPNLSLVKDTKNFCPDFTKPSWSPKTFWNDVRERIDNWEYDRYFYHKACRIIEAEQPDVLYQRDLHYAGVDLSHRYGLPIILEMNGSNSFSAEWRRRHNPIYINMVRRKEQRICRQASSVVVVTPPLKDYLVGLGISKRKVFILPNGVDVSRFFPDEDSGRIIRRRYGLENKLVIGFVGGLRPFHGVHILIDSAKLILDRCHQAHILIVGDGPPRGELELKVRKQGLKDIVSFIGSVPFEEVPAYINAMDITVAPYAKIPQLYQSPIKLFEYMAVGKPIVTTRRPLVEAVIKDYRNGLIFEFGDHHQLASAILKLINDKDLRERLGSEGRRIVEDKYTWEGNAQKITEIYKNLNKQMGMS